MMASCVATHLKEYLTRSGVFRNGNTQLLLVVMYDLLSMSKTGVNWVKCLPDYARTLNSEPKEELSWKSPFEVYYGRKPFRKNDISGASTVQEWNVDEEVYERLTSSLPKDYKSHELQVTRIRKAAALASKRCESRMIKKGLRNNPPSVYDIGEKVLIRYPTAKKLCSKRCVLPARVLKGEGHSKMALFSLLPIES